VLGLISGLKETHLIYSNRESGFGRYDVALFPKEVTEESRGILLEFKVARSVDALQEAARQALQQINSKHYQTELERQGIRRMIKIGLAFSGKQMATAFGE
jgi:hypothetical protein